MTLATVSPAETRRLVEQGAVLVDVREPDEHARENVPGARLLPLSGLDSTELAVPPGTPVIFHCRSGARTAANASRLRAKAGEGCDAYMLEGGLDAWKRAGLPVAVDRRQPLELQRQVQIGAGGLAFLGTLLGILVSPWFLAVPLFVGAGLLTAGITGFCGLARILAHAPWNRATYRPAGTHTA